MTRSERRARNRIRRAQATHSPGDFREPFSREAGDYFNRNPNKRGHAARQGLDGFDPTTGKFVPTSTELRIREASRDHRPLTVRTPITRDRAGRRLPANRQTETSYTI